MRYFWGDFRADLGFGLLVDGDCLHLISGRLSIESSRSILCKIISSTYTTEGTEESVRWADGDGPGT